MSAEPRAALNALIAAFERHLEACAGKRGEDDPTVVAASDDLADAFEAYDDALLDRFNEMTPLEIYGDDDEDGEEDEDSEIDDHDDEDGDDGTYAGLGDDDAEWSEEE
jgi:hypothetical protein